MLDYVIYYILVSIVQLILIYCFKKVTNHKSKIYWKYGLLIIPFSGIMLTEFCFKLELLNAVTSLLCYYILFYLIFKRGIKETIFFGTAIWITGTLVDFITIFRTNLISLLGLFNNNEIAVRAVDTILLQISVLILFEIKKINLIINKFYQRMKNVKCPYFRIALLLVIFCSMGMILLLTIQNENIERISKYIYILTTSVIILICLYLNKEYNNTALIETKLNLIQNNEFYINAVNDYKILKHNIIHQLNGIKSVANKEAQDLITDLIEQYNSNFINVQELTTMPTGINGIIYEKIYTYQNQELKLGIENKITSNIFDNLTARSYNLLCESLGILLDNALEATSDSKEKIIMIDMKETSKSYSVKIINTFSDVLDFDRLGTIKYTTKKKGNGIGLFSIIGRKKLKVKTSIINNLFQNEIIIHKIPKKKIIWS